MINGQFAHASLFSGIGGFDLAAEWMGWRNAFHCEINPFCQRILKYHFPKSESYADITKTNFNKWGGYIDILTGGFPCQPFSIAGKRKGATDDRYLWPQMLRAIREINPAWVIGENVGGIVTMVQPGEAVEVGRSTSLFGENYQDEELRQQYIIETVCADLEREGYSVQPLLIPACAVGAPHRRDRVWFVAHRDSDRCRERTDKQNPVTPCNSTTDNSNVGKARTTPHTDSNRLQTWQKERESRFRMQKIGFDRFPTKSPICGRDDGIPRKLDAITFPKWRAESIKAYGNAIVPQVAYEIFNAINNFENECI